MGFVEKIRIQEEKLNSHVYVEFILSALLKGELPNIDVNDRSEFGITDSDELCTLLLYCNNILEDSNGETPNFTDIKDDYLISLIYCGLCSDDFVAETESPAIQATILFFNLFSHKYPNAFTVDKAVISSVAKKALGIIENRLYLDRKVSQSFILVLKNFLEANIGNLDVARWVDLLITAFIKNTAPVSNSSNVAETETVVTTIFTCLTTIIEKQDASSFRNFFVKLSLKLIKCCMNETSTHNVVNFFSCVLHKYCGESWYLPLLLAILKQIKNKEAFIDIINQLPITKHENMVNIIVSNYVQATSEKEIEMYLTTMNLIVKIPYPNISDNCRQKIVKCILIETYFRSSHKSRAVKERVMELFINWCQMRDIIVRRQLQQMFQSTNKIQIARLFEILLQCVDISWKSPPYNVTFIIFTCRMFMVNKLFISQYRMRVLEMLCHRATPHCLKPCVPVIIEMIRHFTPSVHPILKPMLTVMVDNALTTTNTAKYYMKEIFNLLSNCITASSDSETDFALCNLLLSDDFNCLSLFKTLQAHNFIRIEDIQTLIDEKILKHPCSWKLLSVLLDNVDYTELPQFMEYYITKMNLPSFFSRPEAPHTLQVLSKIFASKIKRNRVIDSDVKVAEMIEEYLFKFTKTLLIPAKQISDAIVLLLTLNKVTNSDLTWFDTFFKETLNCVLNREVNLIGVPFTRHLMYLEQMLILMNIQISPENLTRIVKLMSPKNLNLIMYEHVYSRLISFFGKICLKYESRIPNALNLLEYAMLNGPPPAQMMAVSTLYDMSHIKTSCFEVLYTGLFVLAKNTSTDVKNLAVKMLIKLVNDHYIRLNRNDFITLMLILADRNYKLCNYFIDVFERDFIHQNHHTISKYFIPLLFHLNNYESNETFPVTMETGSLEFNDFTYERRVTIYKFLYCNLERHSQHQILNALNDNFLIPFYKGRINPTSKTLNVLRDVLILVAFNLSQYMNTSEINEIEQFYKALFEDMKRDFFTRKRFLESNDMEFDRTLQKLLISLLRILYKVEKSHLTMLPQVFCTIAVTTRTFYNKILHMVHDSNTLKDLYYEFENCYMKYKEMVRNEPLDLMNQCDKQQWRTFVR